MLSLTDRVKLLEDDLLATPQRISVYAELPFAILRYDPSEEWDLRREIARLQARLQNIGKDVKPVSLADLLWRAVDRTEGMPALVEEETSFGYPRAEETLDRILNDPDFAPLPDLVITELAELNPERSVAILMRAGSMAPGIYHMSKLLDELQGRTKVPTILCYPGSLEGTTGLKYMDLARSEALGNYRVKIYG